MYSYPSIPSASAMCLLCRGIVSCTRECPEKLEQHLSEEHNVFFYKELLVKFHFMDTALLEAFIDYPIGKPKTVVESVAVLNKLFGSKKYVEGNDSFVTVDATISDLVVNDNFYDDVEGSAKFYKEKNVDLDYSNLENIQNSSIEDFIKTLPHDLSYKTEFKSKSEIVEEGDYILDRLNQVDNETVSINTDNDPMKKKRKERVTCEVCKKSLSKGSIVNHMRIFHSGVKNFECEVCNEKFESKMEVIKHKAKVHPREKRGKLNRIISSNSTLDDSSQDGISTSSIADENSMDSTEMELVTRNLKHENVDSGVSSNSYDEDSFLEGTTNNTLLNENSLDTTENLLNVTIPSGEADIVDMLMEEIV